MAQVDEGVRACHESSTVLNGSAVFYGTTYDTAVAPGQGVESIEQLGASRFRAFAASDLAGTLAVEQSRDGATWFQTTSMAIVADFTQGSILESIVTLRYVRMKVTNGATTPQTHAEFNSALVAV